MPRRGRGASRASARAAAASRRVSVQPDPSDTEMQEAQTEQSTPREEVASENEEGNVEDGGDADEADDVDEAGSGLGTPSRSRTRQSATPVVPQKRRAGRPPKNPRPQDWDASDVDTKPASDTPKRGRGGFRGGRGGRWKNRGGSLHVSQVAVDKDGTMANVKDDEVELPEDPDGETKVDKDGHLQEGREYRVRTFTVAGKGRRLYMLSTEPARCIGFRDSYLFFQKHKHLFKIILSEEAKRDLIEREVLPHSYKGRAIGVVTARSVFREFGAKITVGGKKITDDYKVAECRANGDIEGEVAVPEDVLPGPGEEYDRNRFVAWHGASSVYHSGMPTVPLQNGKQEIKKKRIPITDSNWMLEHARAASRFNSQLREMRRDAANGVYDIYTNQMHYPAHLQPTHAKWVEVPPSPQSSNIKREDYEWGPNIKDLSINDQPSSFTINGTAEGASGENKGTSARFAPVSNWQYRNYATIDYEMVMPPRSNLGPIGIDGGEDDFGPRGLCEVTDDVVECLPAECLEPFVKAREEERQWRTELWSCEKEDGLRAEPKITYTAL